jgi:pimeloyl-ACP methyl ester carboxylesterase
MVHSALRLAGAKYEVQTRIVHGYRRAFVCVGSGPAVLLIHGIGNDLDTWGEVIPALAEHYTVIAPDLLGHGRSDRPRADYSVAAYANGMRDLLSVLDIDRVSVVGHSLGGGVATQFAYQYPERCERLVLVSSGGVSRQVTLGLRLLTAPAADLVLGMVQVPGVKAAVHATLGALAALDHDIALDREVVLGMLDGLADAQSRQAFVRTLRAVVDLRGQVVTMLDRCYLAAGMPTLLIWGSRDAVIPLEHAHVARAAMPGSRLEVFEGAGHFPHHANPQRFVQLLCEFLDSAPPATYSPAEWRALLRAGRPGLDARLLAESAAPLPSRLVLA